MKTLLFILTALIVLSCKAQTPLVSLDTYRHQTPSGSYFKDLNNEFDKFVGTWKFTNGNTELIISLQKKEMIFNGKFYEDLIIGEYKYISNGIIVVNTLPLLNDMTVTGRYHNISGRGISNNNDSPTCDSCSANERRLNLFFDDPLRPYLSASITLRYLVGTSPEQITVKLIGGESTILPAEDSPVLMRVPYGTYTMTKQ